MHLFARIATISQRRRSIDSRRASRALVFLKTLSIP
jgi:hypothetical protein